MEIYLSPFPMLHIGIHLCSTESENRGSRIKMTSYMHFPPQILYISSEMSGEGTEYYETPSLAVIPTFYRLYSVYLRFKHFYFSVSV